MVTPMYKDTVIKVEEDVGNNVFFYGPTNYMIPNQCQPQPTSGRHNLKLPHFYRKNVDIWVEQVHSAFSTAGIFDEASRFHITIANLESDVVEMVSDLVFSPPPQTPFITLCGRLKKEFGLSAAQKMEQLMSIRLETSKPSHLLREMRRLAGNTVSAEFLTTLFLQKLPPIARAVLSTATCDLAALAEQADLIMEQPSLSICPISNNLPVPTSPTEDDRFSRLEQQLQSLHMSVDAIRKGATPPQSKNSHTTGTPVLCYFHRRFGTRARKCTQPCSFVSENDSANH